MGDEPRRVAAVEHGPERTTWDMQMRWLNSPEGERYDQQLIDAFNIVRQRNELGVC